MENRGKIKILSCQSIIENNLPKEQDEKEECPARCAP